MLYQLFITLALYCVHAQRMRTIYSPVFPLFPHILAVHETILIEFAPGSPVLGIDFVPNLVVNMNTVFYLLLGKSVPGIIRHIHSENLTFDSSHDDWSNFVSSGLHAQQSSVLLGFQRHKQLPSPTEQTELASVNTPQKKLDDIQRFETHIAGWKNTYRLYGHNCLDFSKFVRDGFFIKKCVSVKRVEPPSSKCVE